MHTAKSKYLKQYIISKTNFASLGILCEKWLSRFKKWHLRGYRYTGDKEAKSCLK